MAGPAPTEELIHKTDQDTKQFHSAVGNELKTSPEQLDPNDSSPLNKIKEEFGDQTTDALHAVNEEVDILTNGENIKTGDRGVVRHNPMSLVWERFRKLRSKKVA